MPANQTILAPSLVAILLEQVAQGNARPASLLSQVQNDIPMSYREHSAKFTKNAPGDFTITLYRDAQQTGTEQASSPVEAKMAVIDYLTSQVRQAQQQEGNNRLRQA